MTNLHSPQGSMPGMRKVACSVVIFHFHSAGRNVTRVLMSHCWELGPTDFRRFVVCFLLVDPQGGGLDVSTSTLYPIPPLPPIQCFFLPTFSIFLTSLANVSSSTSSVRVTFSESWVPCSGAVVHRAFRVILDLPPSFETPAG